MINSALTIFYSNIKYIKIHIQYNSFDKDTEIKSKTCLYLLPCFLFDEGIPTKSGPSLVSQQNAI